MYVSTRAARALPTRNVGWLDVAVSFPVAEPSSKLLERLWRYCSLSVWATRGLYFCPFCEHPSANVAERNGERVLLGSAEIRVFDESGAVAYAAPNLVYHYVAVHHYLPPAAFLDAIESGPPPAELRYQEMLNRAQVTWIVTPPCTEDPVPFRLGQQNQR